MNMQLNILIVGVLFPAIPLMMINFGNRYSLLAGLIRNLHDTVINEKILVFIEKSTFLKKNHIYFGSFISYLKKDHIEIYFCSRRSGL